MGRRSRLALALAFALPAATLLAGVDARAGSSTIHVYPGGGGPLALAIRYARPGQTIVVHGGTYRESAGWRQPGIPAATASNPIRLVAAPGERPVIRGVLKLEDASHWIIDGINITRDPERPADSAILKMVGGNGWVFRNGEIWGSGGVANVSVTPTPGGTPATNWRFVGNCVHDIGTGPYPMNYHNMYVYAGDAPSGMGVIAGNVFFNAPNGNHIKAAAPPRVDWITADLSIRYNTMYRASQGIVVAYRTRNVRIERNIIAGRWGGRSDNPAIRGHELANSTNVAKGNVSYGFQRTVWSSQASNGRVRDLGGNQRIKPAFDKVGSCDGFRPTSAAAKAFGHTALA